MNIILTFLFICQVTAFILAYTNPDIPSWWRLVIILTGVINSTLLLVFFMLRFCLWGLALNCPVGVAL